MKRFPFHRSLKFRIIATLSLVIFLGTLFSAVFAINLAERQFEKLVHQQFRTASDMSENIFELIGQMGLIWSNHFIFDEALKQLIGEGVHGAIGKKAEALRKESTADVVVILDAQGRVLHHTFSPERQGGSLMSWNIVRRSLAGEQLESGVVQDLNNLIIYSPGLLRDDSGQDIGLVLVGYAINDELVRNISKNSQVGVTLVRRRAIMASTFNQPGRQMETVPLSYISYQSMLLNPKNIKQFHYQGMEYLAMARRLARMAQNQEGSILLTFPKKALSEIKQQLMWEYGMLFLFEFILIAIVSARLSANLLHPIHQLMRQMERNDKSDALDFATIESNDEVGIMANRFNQLVGTIHNQNRELLTYSESLEQKVEERTMALNKTYKELARKERGLAHAQHIAKIGSWDWDPVSDRLVCSDEMLKICDIRAEDFHGTLPEFVQVLNPDEREAFTTKLRRSSMELTSISDEYLIHHDDGGEQTLLIESEVVIDEDGNLLYVSGTVQDITDRRQVEKERLAYIERQRDALVAEVHHRIKNHLQGLMGLLKQRKKLGREYVDVLDEAITQIESIAIVYGLQSKNPAGRFYFNQMFDAIVHSVTSLSQIPLTVVNDGARCACEVDRDKAVPLALVINELLMNSVKHFRSESKGREIQITNRCVVEGIVLEISNPGSLPDEFDFEKGRGLGTGLELVKVMLPSKEAQLSISDQDNEVMAKLELSPPLFKGVGNTLPEM